MHMNFDMLLFSGFLNMDNNFLCLIQFHKEILNESYFNTAISIIKVSFYDLQQYGMI